MVDSIRSYQDLLNLLAADGMLHSPDIADHSVRIPTERNGKPGMQFIRWQTEDGVVQFLQLLLTDIPEDKLSVLESAIARLNHALAWPGLDLNHAHRLLSYRLVLPFLPRGAVLPQEIQGCFRLAIKLAADLTPTLLRILSGETSPSQVLVDAQRQLVEGRKTSE